MAYLKYRPNENEVFDFISVPYTITDIQTPEKRQFITRGAKWSHV